MPKPDIDAPTQRILSVVEVISAQGPITLDGLCKALPISRAALWRAVDTLRKMGWVRMRLGDKAFEICAEMLTNLQRGHVSNPAVEAIVPLMETVAKFGPVHVDLGGFSETGVFRILETTRRAGGPLGQAPLSLVDDDIAIAAQLTVPPPSLVLHLRAFMVAARDDERRIITSGEHGRMIARLRDVGHLWGPDNVSVALSLGEFPGFALRCELWRVTRADVARLAERASDFMAARQVRISFDNPLSRPLPMDTKG